MENLRDLQKDFPAVALTGFLHNSPILFRGRSSCLFSRTGIQTDILICQCICSFLVLLLAFEDPNPKSVNYCNKTWSCSGLLKALLKTVLKDLGM